MKLVSRLDDRLEFGLASREKAFLERLIGFYPLEPEPEATLSRTGSDSMTEAEELLRSSLRDGKRELADWLRRRLTEGEALAKAKGEWRLVLEGDDHDRLLRVLNELRVGSWNRLGRPEDLQEEPTGLTPTTVALHAIMMLAGQFEIALLRAVSDDTAPGPSDDEAGGTPPGS